MRISTKAHGAADYATGATLLTAPRVLGLTTRGAFVMRAAGAGVLATSAFTDYELGVRRRIPMRVHLAVDAATGAFLIAAPWLLRSARRGPREWLPHLLAGAGEIAAAALTDRSPADGAATQQPAPPAATGVTGEGVAAGAPGAGPSPRMATPPVETPGPSVRAPVLPESETERAERADALKPDPEVIRAKDPDDALVAREAAAAAAEAGAIGGPADPDAADPAMDPVYQAGGGEQEGFEAAERDLVETATNFDAGPNPLRDALAPEAESDRSTAEYAEADAIRSTELADEPPRGDDTAA